MYVCADAEPSMMGYTEVLRFTEKGSDRIIFEFITDRVVIDVYFNANGWLEGITIGDPESNVFCSYGNTSGWKCTFNEHLCDTVRKLTLHGKIKLVSRRDDLPRLIDRKIKRTAIEIEYCPVYGAIWYFDSKECISTEWSCTASLPRRCDTPSKFGMRIWYDTCVRGLEFREKGQALSFGFGRNAGKSRTRFFGNGEEYLTTQTPKTIPIGIHSDDANAKGSFITFMGFSYGDPVHPTHTHEIDIASETTYSFSYAVDGNGQPMLVDMHQTKNETIHRVIS
jgi:hypothetical protein